MRTVFEDTTERANREEDKNAGKYTPLFLWLFAVIFFFGSWATWRWAANRKPPEPPPPPVSLQDPKQVSDTINKFNRFVQEDNWGEAEKMLSAEAAQTLASQGKTLRASLLGQNQNEKVIEAASTPGGAHTETTVRQDCVYKFAPDGVKYAIIPLTVINDNGRLAINSWGAEEDTKKP
jgi:hypothetical protein